MFVDTHTHLYGTAFDADRELAVKRCLENKVSRLYLPGIDLEAAHHIFQMQSDFPDCCFPMIGLHPCAVDEKYKKQLEELQLLYHQHSKSVVAIGEIGLDYYHDKTFIQQQDEAFRFQIEWALSVNLPIVLHVRNAFNEVLEVLKDYKHKNLKGIFHCFPGNVIQAKQALAMGDFKFGVGGVVTFKKSDIQEVVRELPLDLLVLETDAPYLTPAPYRGQRNESAYIPIIAQKVAEIKNISIETVAQQTTATAMAIFHPNK